MPSGLLSAYLCQIFFPAISLLQIPRIRNCFELFSCHFLLTSSITFAFLHISVVIPIFSPSSLQLFGQLYPFPLPSYDIPPSPQSNPRSLHASPFPLPPFSDILVILLYITRGMDEASFLNPGGRMLWTDI